MNNGRRKILASIEKQLEDLEGQLSIIAEEEQETFDNVPEGIQQSEKGERIQEAADELEEIVSDLSDLRERLLEF